MKESDFQKMVIDLAHLYGWRVAHFRPAKTSRGWRTPVSADGAGFPDLVLAKAGRVLFVELKTDTGRLTDSQLVWLAELPDADVWRPRDWNRIEHVLRDN